MPYVLRILSFLILLYSGMPSYAQSGKEERFKKASSKVERGYRSSNRDTLAQGYYDMGRNYYSQGELVKSEEQFVKAKEEFARIPDASGVAKSSRELAKVQEALNKRDQAVDNYRLSERISIDNNDQKLVQLNRNDIIRLTAPDSLKMQEGLIQNNITLAWKVDDTSEMIGNLNKMAATNLKNKDASAAIGALEQAYSLSKNDPQQALHFNQQLTDVYVQEGNFSKAIETKKAALSEPFVLNSSQLKASEITSLAQVYIEKEDIPAAVALLNESYALAVKNGHTLEAKRCIEKLDSIYQQTGRKDMSLQLYSRFLKELPFMIANDSSLTDNKIIAETEQKLKLLETEKALKDDLIQKKNVLNYWLTGSIIILALLLCLILLIVRKLKIRNKKIALQSLRREMNPHFIFNSLNSINQFIANNNELEANQYLSKFSTLMRAVMENSKEDFVLFSKEAEILQKYLELEKSRFPDTFDFKIRIDEALYAEEQLFVPGMLIQPHLENAIWHGLRYTDEKGMLLLSFVRRGNTVEVTVEDNGIGIAESKKVKTPNQLKHTGRGITNTLERIKILNELYHQHIKYDVEDKAAPDHGVKVKITMPLLKSVSP